MTTEVQPQNLNGPVTDEFKQQLIMKVVVWGVGLTAGYFFVVKPILEKVGVLESKEERYRKKQEQELGVGDTSPFNPNYYKKVPGALLVTKATAESLAKQFYNAIGNFGDDENAVYAGLRTLKAKTQLSFVSEIFAQKHNADLYQYLRRNLNDSEMDVVNSIANNLAGVDAHVMGFTSNVPQHLRGNYSNAQIVTPHLLR